MLRRLIALLAVVVVTGVVLLVSVSRRPADASTTETPAALGSGVRNMAKTTLLAVGHELQDAKVTASVKTALSLNRSLLPYSISVSTESRVVTLRGKVASQELRGHAVAVATEVPGVAHVQSELETPPLKPVPMPPNERAAAAQRAVNANLHVARFDLMVRVRGERLVLYGHVMTPAEKDLAGMLARDAAGGPVENEVEVRPGTL